MKKALHFCCKAHPKWVLVTVWRILIFITFWPLQPHRDILSAKANLQFSTFSKSTKYVRPKCIFAKTEVCCQLNKSRTAMSEYRAIQFCQFSPASYGMLACVGDLPMMAKPHFQGQDRRAFWLRPEMNESLQGLTLQQGASPALSSSEKLLSLVPGTSRSATCPGSKRQISLSSYPNSPTWERTTQRTRRN